jgi:oligopeptide transport system permease protein
MQLALRRLAMAIPLLLVISGVMFVLMRLAPGGPFDKERAPASPEIERALRARYHLDAPLWSQYLRYLGLLWEQDAEGKWQWAPGGLVKGDFGPSLKYRSHTVNDIMAQSLPVTLTLGVMAFGLAAGLGIPWGVWTALRRGQWTGFCGGFLVLFMICVPALVLGPLLVLMFALKLRWFPVALWESPWHAVLPTIALGLFFAGRVARLMREGMIETLQAEFIITARAKGLGNSRILLRHALPLAILPVVSYTGPLLADLLTGSFIVENIFQIPGIGVFMVNSTLSRDYPMVLGLVLLYAIILLGLNLLVDLLYRWLDPRLRHG